MAERLDGLVESAALEPPPDFLERVMREAERYPRPRVLPGSPDWLSWVAAAVAVAIGVGQLIAFMFTVWIAAAIE